MNTPTNPLGAQDHFRQTLDALTSQIGRLMAIAYLRHPNPTETLEAISIAKYLLAKVGDQLTASVTGGTTPAPEPAPATVELPTGRLDNIRRAAALCGNPVASFVVEWLGDI